MKSFKLNSEERQAVIAAYQAADASKKNAAACYAAAIDALHRLYPGASRNLVASQAVKVLTSDVKLVDVARRAATYREKEAHAARA